MMNGWEKNTINVENQLKEIQKSILQRSERPTKNI